MISVYIAFIRNAFLSMLAYRARYYTGILTYLISVSVYYFIWKAIYPSTDAIINGFSINEMITYISIGWISRSFYFSNIDNEIDELVSSGNISSYLIRPVDFQITMLCRAVGESLFRMLFFSFPIGVVICYVFSVNPPSSLTNFIYFCLSTFLAFLILAAINFIIGLSAFYLKSIDGLLYAKQNIIQFLSGLLIPIAFFPDSVARVLELLPFTSIVSIPLKFYLGKISINDAAVPLLIQLFWAVTLIIIGRVFSSHAFGRLTHQGG